MPLSPSIRRTLAVAGLFVLLAPHGYAQTTLAARQLLDTTINVLGGRWFLESREIRTEGRFYTFKRNEIATSDLFTDYVKFPDRERLEFGKKDRTIHINRGSEGWILTPPAKGKDPDVEPQTPGQINEFQKNFRTSFDYILRFVIQTPKASILVTGSDIVDSKRADIIEIRDADKNLMRISIDRETHLPLKMQTRLANEAILYEESYANWHRFDAVMTPLMIVRHKDGVKTTEIRVEDAKYDAGFADSLFAPPAKSK